MAIGSEFFASMSASVVNLASSAFFGGPERQMLGLAQALPDHYRPTFLVFAERGRGRPLLDAARRAGFAANEVTSNTPNLPAMVQEVARQLRELRAGIVCCHGYKADVVGLAAARLAGLHCVGVSHGWMAYTSKLAVYMACDWLALRQMDTTVAVCDAQAERLRARGVLPRRIVTIRNAVNPGTAPRPALGRARLEALFPIPPSHIIGAACRLSLEKGIDVLIRAAQIVAERYPGAGFVIFGDGPQRTQLSKMIAARRLGPRFVLAGFQDDLDSLLPSLDVAVLPSRSEALPVAVLEYMAASVPVVASQIGGIPEAIVDGRCGYLFPVDDHRALADRLMALLASPERRRAMGTYARERILADFTFAVQAQAYTRLFAGIVGSRGTALARPSETYS